MSPLDAYLTDASGFPGHAERLFTPSSAEEVSALLQEAARLRVPVTISGAGTGLAGGRVPQGGWILSTEKFDRLEIHPHYALAAAGVSLARLHAAAQATRQFFPPDPTETTASLGGAIAANASGARSFRYGDTRRWVESLTVVLPSGEIRSLARGVPLDIPYSPVTLPRSRKHSAGYYLTPHMDWIDLFIGSEGTLGVIVEARLRLLPQPPALLAGVVFFPSVNDACDAVDSWRDVPSLRMLEFLDDHSLSLLRPRFPDIPPAARAALLIEQELKSDNDPRLEEWLLRLEQSAALAELSWFGFTPADRERFRRFRHALPETVNDIVRRQGFLKLGTDFAVPLSANRDMLAFYRRHLEEEFPGSYVIFGHIGDAHLHVNILPRSPADFDRASALIRLFAAEAVRLGGTVAAEHGVGKRKAHLLPLQYSPADLASMRAVKSALDPLWLLGRGTIFSDPPPTVLQ